MFSRGEWLRIWIVLTAIWTIVVAAWGWINLPRAQHIPHDPEFLNRLSNEAALILNGGESRTKPSRWRALIWSDAPISVPMPNGTRLTFPSTTTNEMVAFVRNEYSKLLEAEAGAQRRSYALGVIITWLFACPVLLILRFATDLICRVYRPTAEQGAAESAAVRWMIKTRNVARRIRMGNPPSYESSPRWGVAARNAEPGF